MPKKSSTAVRVRALTIVAAITRVSGVGSVTATAQAKAFTADESQRLIAAVETGERPREILQQILSRIADAEAAKGKPAEPVTDAPGDTQPQDGKKS